MFSLATTTALPALTKRTAKSCSLTCKFTSASNCWGAAWPKVIQRWASSKGWVTLTVVLLPVSVARRWVLKVASG